MICDICKQQMTVQVMCIGPNGRRYTMCEKCYAEKVKQQEAEYITKWQNL